MNIVHSGFDIVQSGIWKRSGRFYGRFAGGAHFFTGGARNCGRVLSTRCSRTALVSIPELYEELGDAARARRDLERWDDLAAARTSATPES